jgi:hypothetical protein
MAVAPLLRQRLRTLKGDLQDCYWRVFFLFPGAIYAVFQAIAAANNTHKKSADTKYQRLNLSRQVR